MWCSGFVFAFVHTISPTSTFFEISQKSLMQNFFKREERHVEFVSRRALIRQAENSAALGAQAGDVPGATSMLPAPLLSEHVSGCGTTHATHRHTNAHAHTHTNTCTHAHRHMSTLSTCLCSRYCAFLEDFQNLHNHTTHTCVHQRIPAHNIHTHIHNTQDTHEVNYEDEEEDDLSDSDSESDGEEEEEEEKEEEKAEEEEGKEEVQATQEEQRETQQDQQGAEVEYLGGMPASHSTQSHTHSQTHSPTHISAHLRPYRKLLNLCSALSYRGGTS